jgi:hypothetical protein
VLAIPNTIVAEITRSVMRMTADCSQIHNKCDRRECRLERGCMAEEFLGERVDYCGDHWSDDDRSSFWGAIRFGMFRLCPSILEGAYPKDYRRKEGDEDNPNDLPPKILLIPRKVSIRFEKMPYGDIHIHVRAPVRGNAANQELWAAALSSPIRGEEMFANRTR